MKKKHGTQPVQYPPCRDLQDKRLLSLDLGRRTGWSVAGPDIADSGIHELYCERNTLHPYQDGERFAALARFLDASQEAYGPFAYVAFEDVPARAMKSRQAILYPGYRATLMSWCHIRGIPVLPIPVATVKKAVASGNAKKSDVVEAVRKLGFLAYSEDEADAIAVMVALRQISAEQRARISQITVDNIRKTKHSARVAGDADGAKAAQDAGGESGARRRRGLAAAPSARTARRKPEGHPGQPQS